MAYTLVDDAPTKGGYTLIDEEPKQPGINDRGGMLQNIAGGILSGAGQIGSTIMSPIDMVARSPFKQALNLVPGGGALLQADKMLGGNTLIGRDDRRAAMDQALTTAGVNTDSGAFKTGKIGTEIAGTLGVGGAIAKPVQALAATRYASGMEPVIEGVVKGLQTGGFRIGELANAGRGVGAATRAITGAVTGGATAGLVNPDDAKTGAMIGGALPGAVQVAGKAGQLTRSLGKNILGATTGTSPETISAAFNAGKAGNTEFLRNMRGDANFDDVVDLAKQGLSNMRATRGAEYRSGMVDISKDKAVLDFAPIDSAISKVKELGSYKGIQTNKNAASVVNELDDVVSQWRQLDPAEYHTPEGLDALKKSIGDIRDATQFGTPARKAADTVYNSVKAEISKQAPTYNKVMADYSTASKELSEIEKALSLGDKASKDTAMRKMQSLMRNNAQTNYGNRLSLAKQLEEKGGVSLTPAIAGQAMGSMLPRGMTGALQKAGGTALAGASIMNPALLASFAAAPLASPRLVGEAVYRAGLLSGKGAGTGAGLLGSPMSQEALANFSRTAPILMMSGQAIQPQMQQ